MFWISQKINFFASFSVNHCLNSLRNICLQWALMTLLDPTFSMENLIYIGYAADISTAIRVTRKRRVDRKKQISDRNVFQCFVFGPKKSGKSALLDSFLGRFIPLLNNYFKSIFLL